MTPFDSARGELSRLPERHSGPTASDRHWTRHRDSALACAAALLSTLILTDWAAGTLAPWRGVIWLILSALLFLMLCPPRVTAGPGWLETRFLLRTRRLRTDLLVTVGCHGGVAQRVMLRDAFGDCVELDPRVLVDNPDLWRHLDAGAHHSESTGTLRCGRTALRRLVRHVDHETALAVFRVSGLEEP
ncbi:hypothetical protein SUDANB105_06325 [Streptomyces sp. enrichment culture]|uniref:hypothetical protein n=1 Tax=Streptomyces sp. enrichment culture TaxID=1795815 RepID=UPI003F548740